MFNCLFESAGPLLGFMASEDRRAISRRISDPVERKRLRRYLGYASKHQRVLVTLSVRPVRVD